MLARSLARWGGEGEREARKNIISTQHGGSHSPSLHAVSADRHHVWLVQSIELAALGKRTVNADHFVH